MSETSVEPQSITEQAILLFIHKLNEIEVANKEEAVRILLDDFIKAFVSDLAECTNIKYSQNISVLAICEQNLYSLCASKSSKFEMRRELMKLINDYCGEYGKRKSVDITDSDKFQDKCLELGLYKSASCYQF